MLNDVALRRRGPKPSLSDTEVLTMLMVGEYFGLGNDKKIWGYFRRHWQHFFPKLGCLTSFLRQGANLFGILNKLHAEISGSLGQDKEALMENEWVSIH